MELGGASGTTEGRSVLYSDVQERIKEIQGVQKGEGRKELVSGGNKPFGMEEMWRGLCPRVDGKGLLKREREREEKKARE